MSFSFCTRLTLEKIIRACLQGWPPPSGFGSPCVFPLKPDRQRGLPTPKTSHSCPTSAGLLFARASQVIPGLALGCVELEKAPGNTFLLGEKRTNAD